MEIQAYFFFNFTGGQKGGPNGAHGTQEKAPGRQKEGPGGQDRSTNPRVRAPVPVPSLSGAPGGQKDIPMVGGEKK